MRVGQSQLQVGWRGRHCTRFSTFACQENLLEHKTRRLTRNVSPTIQAGWPGCGLTFEPAVMSKIAPRHWPVWPLLTGPRFRSASLIGHEGPPKDIEMFNWALHAVYLEHRGPFSQLSCVKLGTLGAPPPQIEGKYVRKEKKPLLLPVRGAEFGTAPQIAFTAAVGAPISVVPVSMAAVFVVPMLTLSPFTVTPARTRPNQSLQLHHLGRSSVTHWIQSAARMSRRLVG